MRLSKDEIEQLMAHARQVELPPAAESEEEVALRGEPLRQPIYWTGRQWAVTEFGLEARNGSYPISKRRLWDDEGEWGWVQSLSGREWIDLADFAEALRIARQRWAPADPRPSRPAS